jgi:hypothetical protein
MGTDNRFKKLARTLMATTCLTVAAGSASASVFLEPSFAGGDFSNNLSAPSALPVGTTQVQGAVNNGDHDDFFSIPGLTTGASYLLLFAGSGGGLSVYDGLSLIGGPFSNSVVTTFTSPDTTLVFGVHTLEATVNYTVSLTQETPEPGTLSLAGMALAGALALRRRKKN